jgi:serine/threonine protein kinase
MALMPWPRARRRAAGETGPDLHVLRPGGSSDRPESDPAPPPTDTWRPGIVAVSSARPDELDALLDEFADHWRHGLRPRAEDFVGRLQGRDPADVVELVYHEFCLAEAVGLGPNPATYLDRFPDHRDRLARLFGLHEALTPSELGLWVTPAELPRVGDQIGPYRLVRELGRGSFARVFLAEQSDLEDRPVVLKVATRGTPEPRLLARARHPHIVEVLRHGATDDGTLHLLCMPFLGGATLAQVLAGRRRAGCRARSGRDLLADLDRASAPEYLALGASPARGLLASLSYPKAVAWLIARLAEALDHARRRGVTHGDLKPSNILLAADGQPMLFDFNLALDWRGRDELDLLDDPGGTLAYMAPERLRVLSDPDRASSPNSAALHRADIYALGLILAEALAGEPPRVPGDTGGSLRAVAADLVGTRSAGGPFLREILASVSPGLRPILFHCLHPDPDLRYRDARELAEDLDRYRLDRPPAYAASPSWTVSLARWSRRQRVALAAAVLVLVAGGLAALAVSRSYRTPLRTLAIAKLNSVWSGSDLDAFPLRRIGLYASDSPEARAEIARRNLDRYEVLGPDNWRLRDDVRYLPDADRADLEVWILEQAWRAASSWAGGDRSPESWRLALECLERASGADIPGPMGDLAADLRRRLGCSPWAAGSCLPAWVGDAVAGFAEEARWNSATALTHYRNALKGCPDSFWIHYRASVVASHIGDYRTGLAHIERCVTLQPENPRLRVASAGVRYFLGDYDLGLEQLDRAGQLDPELADVYRSRALLWDQLGESAKSAADLDRYVRLESGKKDCQPVGLALDIRSMRGPSSWRDPDLPTGSLAALATLPDSSLESSAALALLLRDLGRNDEAAEILGRLVDRGAAPVWIRYVHAELLRKMGNRDHVSRMIELLKCPGLPDLAAELPEVLRVHRIVASELIRADRVEEAVSVAQEGLEQAERWSRRPGTGPPDRSRVLLGEHHYTLARACATAGVRHRELDPQARIHLRRAFQLIPSQVKEWTAIDTVFDGLRSLLPAGSDL